MALQAEDPPCHLLRAPYEILKPVLAELNQQDQLSVSKTCVTLWQLAYPMVYNRIVVKIGPASNDSAWEQLASGVGLRYVRHLEIHSLYEENDQPKKIEDLIAGTLIAALRRHQLLSFRFTTSAMSSRSISSMTLVILLETQRLLRQLEIPILDSPSKARLPDYLGSNARFPCLQKLVFTMSTLSAANNELLHLIKRSKNTEKVHLRLATVAYNKMRDFPRLVSGPPQAQMSLISSITKLTFHGCRFGNYMPYFKSLSFPSVRALAVVQCFDWDLFFFAAKPEHFPALKGLIIKDGVQTGTYFHLNFIQNLRNLRELVLDFNSDHFGNRTLDALVQHAATLHLLLFRGPAVESNSDQMERCLSSCQELRHLGLMIEKVYSWDIASENLGSDLRGARALNYLSFLNKLQTLSAQFVVCLTSTDFPLGPFEYRQLTQGLRFEKTLGSQILERFRKKGMPTGTVDSLQYLSVQNEVQYSIYLTRDEICHDLHMEALPPPKHMFDLELGQRFRRVDKEEIMLKYGGDGYSFLEEYVDGMIAASYSTVKDFSPFFV